MKALLEISGRGGELVVCPLTNKAYEYWSSRSEEDLEQYVIDGNCASHPTVADFAIDAAGDHRPWSELDELGHFFGGHPRHCNLVVTVSSDEGTKKILNGDLRQGISRSKSKLRTTAFAKKKSTDRRPAIQIFSYEKGCFFEGSFEFETKKDLKDLEFHVTGFHSESIITNIFFQGHEVENIGGDTTGKGFFATLCQV